MILIRNKVFADLPQSQNQPNANPSPKDEMLTSKELMIEQMKQQRQIMQTQRLRQKIQAQENRDQLKAIQNAQRVEREEKDDDMKNNIKVKRIENQDNSAEAKNVSLYKTRSKIVPPVPMK